MYEIKNKCSVTLNEFFVRKDPGSFKSYTIDSIYSDNPKIASLSKFNKTNDEINLIKYQSPKLSVGVLRHRGNCYLKYSLVIS